MDERDLAYEEDLAEEAQGAWFDGARGWLVAILTGALR